MSIRTVIIDDEVPARDELAYLLSFFADIELVGQAGSAGKGIEMIRSLRPDLVFQDIQMPGKDGFHVVRETLSTVSSPPLFVFATAFDRYALQAFEENAVDYLLKPFSRDRMAKSLDRVRSRLSRNREQYSVRRELECLMSRLDRKDDPVRIPVEFKGRVKLLAPEEIAFFSVEDRRVNASTRDGRLPLYGQTSIDGLEQKLSGHPFFRAHRAFLVNMCHIDQFSPWFNGKYLLTMSDADKSEVVVSKGRVKLFKERLGI
jgi:two-component system LytT family response regulator/two-component system response regulator LytT